MNIQSAFLAVVPKSFWAASIIAQQEIKKNSIPILIKNVTVLNVTLLKAH